MSLHDDVFRQQVWAFFCDDLESCLFVSKLKQCGIKEFKGGLNFTAALTIFSVIDFLAGFWMGKKAEQSEIAKFICKYFGKYSLALSDEKLCKQFYNVFRNGLSHQWSPKLSGVAMDFTVEHLILEDKSTKLLHLNVPFFYKISVKAFWDYEKDLDSDPTLAEKFKRRYDNLIENDGMQSLEYFKSLYNFDVEKSKKQ
jgi:hypothetical protein